MATTILYRATKCDGWFGTGSCWTPDIDCARAYMDNLDSAATRCTKPR